MRPPIISRSATDRRAGYAAGIVSAGAALMADLEHMGALDDAEVLSTGPGGAQVVCTPCELRARGYSGLADRYEFAVNVARQDAP